MMAAISPMLAGTFTQKPILVGCSFGRSKLSLRRSFALKNKDTITTGSYSQRGFKECSVLGTLSRDT